jgi:hypothetical protein
MIQQHGRIRLLIEMFLYTTVLLADNEKIRLNQWLFRNAAWSTFLELASALKLWTLTVCPTNFSCYSQRAIMANTPSVAWRRGTQVGVEFSHVWPPWLSFRGLKGAAQGIFHSKALGRTNQRRHLRLGFVVVRGQQSRRLVPRRTKAAGSGGRVSRPFLGLVVVIIGIGLRRPGQYHDGQLRFAVLLD